MKDQFQASQDRRATASDIALFFKELGVQPTQQQMYTANKWKFEWISKAMLEVS
jgi:hypothetical protein